MNINKCTKCVWHTTRVYVLSKVNKLTIHKSFDPNSKLNLQFIRHLHLTYLYVITLLCKFMDKGLNLTLHKILSVNRRSWNKRVINRVRYIYYRTQKGCRLGLCFRTHVHQINLIQVLRPYSIILSLSFFLSLDHVTIQQFHQWWCLLTRNRVTW